MVDQNLSDRSASGHPPPTGGSLPPPQRRRLRRVLFLGFLIGGLGLATWWSGMLERAFPFLAPSPPVLTAELTVVIRPAEVKEAFLLQEDGALPVRAGASMSLQVNYSQPMYSYLLWLDSQGKVVPLYPWNNEGTAITDANQAPPKRSATRLLLSPTLGSGWPIGSTGGLETVILLARSTPLSENLQFGSHLSGLPPTKLRHRQEAAVLGLERGQRSVSVLFTSHRGDEAEVRDVDQPLLARMESLREQFDAIRIVRFAHEGN